MATNQMGLASKSKLTAIANAIRSKLGVSTQYSLDDMPNAIASISGGGGITPSGTIQIAENGTFDVTQYASAAVNVSGGGGTKVLTKLYEYEISESVSSISITPTAQMLSCEWLYIVYNGVTLSTSDWLYIAVNGLSSSLGYDGKSAEYNQTRLLTLIPNMGTESLFCSVNTVSGKAPTNINSLTSINFRKYTSGVTFESGSIEIWGYV